MFFKSKRVDAIKTLWGAAGLFLALGLFLLGKFYYEGRLTLLFAKEDESPSQTKVTVFDGFFEKNSQEYTQIKKGENFSSTLKRLKVPQKIIDQAINAFKEQVNLKTLKEGTGVMIETFFDKVQWYDLENEENKDHIVAIELMIKENQGLVENIYAFIDKESNNITIKKYLPNVEKVHNIFKGKVSDSLYSSMLRDGSDPQLINNFADIFAWQIDFYRETMDGDQYQLIVEQNIVDGREAGFGQILAAEYKKSNKAWRAIYFESRDKAMKGYFDEEGRSLKNAFLKAPLKLAQISSRFGMRFHPVQKRYKPHNGVDYGAAKNTPIMAVASGMVINAGYTPFNGNWVRIRHMNGYETEYLHATTLAKGVRVGARINQGQVIAYVGKTGLASGYHLHFGMKLNGKYVNPSTQKFAKTEKIDKRYLTEFKRKMTPWALALNRQTLKRDQILAKD